MNHFISQRTKHALQIIHDYKGQVPLHHYLKQYYRLHKNMGSKDRKTCSELVYSYYRIGNALRVDENQKLMYAAFLSAEQGLDFLFEEVAELKKHLNKSLLEKIEVLKEMSDFRLEQLLPFESSITEQLNMEKFRLSMLIKPRTFIRIKSQDMEMAVNKLNSNEISFRQESENCLSFEQRLNITDIITEAIPYEIQDLSSQQTAAFLKTQGKEHWLDCCAASGGKTLLLFQENNEIQITATDIRASILENYEERMKKNGFQNFSTQVWDASSSEPLTSMHQFDGIVADVPCSGSGTWSRHPEHVTFFDPEKINDYQATQKSIVKNAVNFLKPGGKLVYITCSVFSKENEEVSQYIQLELGLSLTEQKYLIGSGRQSDTMFVASFRN
jgi:16S rRNA (cytosine967-C5)-methyltransferase